MKREEVLSFVNEVIKFDGVNPDVKVEFVDDYEQQNLDDKNSIVYIDRNVFDYLQDEVQKFLIIYAVLLLSGDGIPKSSSDVSGKAEWANEICQSLAIPCLTEKDLSVQEMYARRKCYSDKKSTKFEVGQVLIKPPYVRQYTISNIGEVTIDNKRPISLKTAEEEIVLDEETLIREYAILSK